MKIILQQLFTQHGINTMKQTTGLKTKYNVLSHLATTGHSMETDAHSRRPR